MFDSNLLPLPEELQIIIIKYLFGYSLRRIKNSMFSVWHDPSKELIHLCKDDVGAIQYGHHDFYTFTPSIHRFEMLKNSLYSKFHYGNVTVSRIWGDIDSRYRTAMEMTESCLQGRCTQCQKDGFPCINSCTVLFHTQLAETWKNNI